MTSSPAVLQRFSSSSRGTKMGIWLIGMGVLHFAAPKPFDSIVPEELPGTQRFYTLASGVAEVGVGALLVAPKTRRFGALAAIALFLGVLPGNVNMVRLWKNKPLAMRLIAIARLPIQVPMITQALKVYRES
ncbi:DoxX family protein [Mycolicibacterium psychrotolerans]|uniref:Membrane protein n=1 Tax=Mycolicibacterium psychrotolerans TaxID=216929 RepID=A0A7I7MH43_9MYCO|nr:hypothetical protein [Mycolicibacterium psychrotolerans]BBX71426.1 membrane protein [Mycolicibacterium psychrotolerans]